MTPLLELDRISKRFGGLHALADVSFTVACGEILGLIGPNGAGKTTLFNCISGLHPPSSGTILYAGSGGLMRINGRKPEQMTALGIARTFQNIRLFNSLTVLDNVRIARHCRTHANFVRAVLRTRFQRAEEQAIVEAAMERLRFVGLAHHALADAGNLAYGDQRRLEIARALATEPRLLLLDEPAAGMNPRETRRLVDLIQAIVATGVTVILIEHDMKLVMSICRRLVVLDHGTHIAEGPPAAIRENPRVIEAYLGRGAVHA
ncbi:ABC transporter ATP-binding protein [Desulfatitalea alkaliphila]|uniref:ABC transporter ATP-binding protein n=1 Tax=Desulfatitalea alkaliphila TaxID=2929485 RepID=A0AA41R6X7_9BACT|nr:ABC transporter ATP-binding protein [Desulfatitalea alkaliphila]